jgi:hypothetical protein
MTVGYAEVLYKRAQWRAMAGHAQRAFIADHTVPAVTGPHGRSYIVDHHHLCLALLKEGVPAVRLGLQADFSNLDRDEFWLVMDHRQWAHPYDARGRRLQLDRIPKKLDELADDPYRSLAAAVRMAGGFPKDQTPFAEFQWADFFRRRVGASVLKRDPDSALARALALAHSREAMHLPGWAGSQAAS